jgi:zinc protease
MSALTPGNACHPERKRAISRAGSSPSLTTDNGQRTTRWGTSCIALLAVLIATALFAQDTPPPPDPLRPMPPLSIEEHRLPNGLTVVLAPLANVPKVTAILSFRGGRGSTSNSHPGLAQLTARVAAEGTSSRTSLQIKEELRSIGGALDMTTDADHTAIHASSLAEDAAHLLSLMSDVARHPAFRRDEVALAKENLINEIRESRSDPSFLANERFMKAIFGSSPYGFVAPREDSVRAITRAQMKQLAADRWAPNNAHLIVVGDFDPGPMLAAVEQKFGDWPGGAAVSIPFPPPPQREKRTIEFVDRPDSVQSQIYLGNVAIPRRNPDYYALRTASIIYGESSYSRLGRNLREDKGYTYTPFSTADTRARSGFFLAGAAVRNAVTGPSILEMLYELDRMRVLPVSNDELAAAKSFSTGNFAIELSTQSDLANRIDSIYTYGLPHDFIQTFRAHIEALTPADIQKAAARYFDSYRGVIVVVGDYATVKDQVTPFGTLTLYDSEGHRR